MSEEKTNGVGYAKEGPLEGWVIAQIQGLTLIGRPVQDSDGTRGLMPVYEIQPQMQQGPDGINIGHLIVPVWLLGVPAIAVPKDAVVAPIALLTRTQRAALAAGVSRCADAERQIKAHESGLVLASAATKLPPFPVKR